MRRLLATSPPVDVEMHRDASSHQDELRQHDDVDVDDIDVDDDVDDGDDIDIDIAL